MDVTHLMPVGVVLIAALSGCASARMEAVWPEPRPLGQHEPAFQAPKEPPAIPSPGPQPEEPTGVLTLRQALALAPLQNPALASATWEVRAGEAHTLQAGLLPNPEFGVEVENFAGSGEFR